MLERSLHLLDPDGVTIRQGSAVGADQLSELPIAAQLGLLEDLLSPGAASRPFTVASITQA